MNIELFAELSFYLWVLSEIFILIKTKIQRKNIKAENKDKSSILLIVVGIFVCIFLNQICNKYHIGYVNEAAANIGSFLIIIGTVIRLSAVIILGRNFSLSVSVDSKQTIIQYGPYKVVRHPAYTGLLLTLVSVGLAFQTWVGSLLAFIIFMIIFGYRIRVEEKALMEMFPEDYPAYSKKTARLIPFIW